MGAGSTMVADRRHQRRSRAALAAALVLALLALWPAAAAAGATVLPALTNDLKLPGAVGVAGATAPAFAGLTSGLPTATEPAAFAAGSVAVSVIFPQSSGAGGTTHTEKWATLDQYGTTGLTSAAYPNLTPRQVYILGQVQQALDWWATRAPAAAHLSFVVPAYGTLGYPRQVKVAREPIDVASTNDQAWRHPIMAKLGFKAASSADSPPPETAYDNAVRKANHTDWAFTVYVVDSLHDDAAGTHNKTPGEFPDGAFSYTFDLFGPYSVTTYDNDSYGPADYGAVLAHEIGHVFGALDEYAAETGYPSTGSDYSGYLWVRNRNAVKGGTTNDVCIMRGGSEGVAAFFGQAYGNDQQVGGICPSTAGQVGWRVTRAGLPDVVDTTPTVTVAPPTSTDGSTATVGGRARENAWPPGHNAKGRAFARGISIFVPHDLTYSLDGGATQAVTTVTTSGAKASFAFTVDTSTLVAGPYAGAPTRHLVTVQATTGTTASGSAVLWAAGTPVTLTLSAGSATIPLGGKVKLTVHAADADDTSYPIGSLAGVEVGPSSGATPAARTVTTGAGGAAVLAFSPRFSTSFQASFTPTAAAGTAEFEAAASGSVTVAVRAALSARAAMPTAAGVVAVTGAFRPLRAGVPLLLQRLSGGAWTTVAHARTTARSTFRLVYAAPAGALRLRVRFAGDARNAAATKALPVVSVS